MRRVLVTTLLLPFILGGCSSKGMDKAECVTADWRAIGYEDGSKGYRSDTFGRHRKACASHRVTANFDTYLTGHAEGLKIFCRPQNGYNVGVRGYRYSGVCPPHLEAAFVKSHSTGFGLYQRRTSLNNIGKRLAQSKGRSKKIEKLVVRKTTLLASSNISITKRTNIAVEIKQLSEEGVEVARRIEQLEQEHAVAKREYESYRGSIAN